MTGAKRRDQGSVLLPVVAAMLILMLTGRALSETWAAQRMQSALAVQSVRALWIAEAGVWHAAEQQTDLPTAVPFADGSYTVTKSANDYTATAVSGDATRVISQTLIGG